jgi:GAF domain-containing protein
VSDGRAETMTEIRLRPLTTRSFRNAYSQALDRHIRAPREATLRGAYELGREAIDLEVSMLDVATAHHDALRALLHSSQPDDLDEVMEAAADFLAEALTASEVVRRRFREIQQTEREQRHHAAVIRQLSTLLADTSLAAHGRDSLAEVLQLVVEHTSELTRATRCEAALDAEAGAERIEAVSDHKFQPRADDPELIIPLTSLDGSSLGTMALWSGEQPGFSELDHALAVHLAQMASAAVDRARFYRLHAFGRYGR